MRYKKTKEVTQQIPSTNWVHHTSPRILQHKKKTETKNTVNHLPLSAIVIDEQNAKEYGAPTQQGSR